MKILEPIGGNTESIDQAGPFGAPAIGIYSALIASGCSTEQFNSIMFGLVETGRLACVGNVYFMPTAIRLAPHPLPIRSV